MTEKNEKNSISDVLIEIDKKNVIFKTNKKITLKNCNSYYNYCNIYFNLNDSFYELFALQIPEFDEILKSSNSLHDYLLKISNTSINLKNIPLRKMTPKKNSNFKNLKYYNENVSNLANRSKFVEMLTNCKRKNLVVNYNRTKLLLKFNTKFQIYDNEFMSALAIETDKLIISKIEKSIKSLEINKPTETNKQKKNSVKKPIKKNSIIRPANSPITKLRCKRNLLTLDKITSHVNIDTATTNFQKNNNIIRITV